MNADLLALFDQQQRRDIEHPGMRREVLPHVVRFVRPAAGMNYVLFSRLHGADVDAVIREQVAYFRQFDQPFEWKVYEHDWPPDLCDRLKAHGFEPDDDPAAVMILDLAQLPPSLRAPDAVEVRSVTRREDLEDVVRILEQVHGKTFDWITDRLGDHLAIPGYVNVYVIDAAGAPACSGWIYHHPNSQFASLWGGATVAGQRRRGLYTAMLAVRVQEALRRGYRYVTIDAGQMSRPIVARHGFQLLTRAFACEWKGERRQA